LPDNGLIHVSQKGVLIFPDAMIIKSVQKCRGQVKAFFERRSCLAKKAASNFQVFLYWALSLRDGLQSNSRRTAAATV
jgi:hypothetical protein